MSATTTPPEYRLTPPERTGWLSVFEGWRLIAFLCVAVVTMVLMYTRHFIVGGILPIVAGVYIFGRIRNAYVSDLAPLAGGLALRGATGQLKSRSGAETAGHDALTSKAKPVPLPPSIKGVQIDAIQARGGRGGKVGVAVINNRYYTAALKVTGEDIVMADVSDQAAVLHKWGSIADSYAHDESPIRDIRWVEIAVPEDPNGIRSYFENHRDRRLKKDNPILVNYAEIVEQYAHFSPSTEHELFVMLTLDASSPGARKAIRRVNRKDRREGAKQVLLEQIMLLRQKLTHAGWHVHYAMSPGMIGRATREAYAPHERTLRTMSDRLAGKYTALELANAVPQDEKLALRHSYYETDNTFHRSYYIEGWPRVPVGTDWFGTMTLQTTCMRRIAVHIRVTPQRQAMAQVSRTRSNIRGDAKVREKHGFESTEEHDNQAEAVNRQAKHVADGHALYTVSGTITVSAFSLEQLERADAEIRNKAARAGISLQTCYGRQDAAFARTLLLGF